MIKKQVLFSAFVFLFMTCSYGQVNKIDKKFVKIVEKDSIVFSYRWKTKPNTKHKGPLKLDLKIENKSPKSKEVSLVVDVFINTILYASSEKQTYCISPRKIIFGDKKYSSFDVSEFKPEDLEQEYITIDLSEIEIKEVDVCK